MLAGLGVVPASGNIRALHRAAGDRMGFDDFADIGSANPPYQTASG